jgi:hypothetical protein
MKAVTMKVVVYTPEVIPIISASAKSRIVPDVNMKSDITASMVVTVVMMVLLSVSVSERFSMLTKDSSG